MRRLAALVAARPWLTLACAAAIAVGGALVAPSVTQRMTSGGFDVPGSEGAAASDAVDRASARGENNRLLVLVRNPTPARLAALQRLLGDRPLDALVPARDRSSVLAVVPGISDADARRLERRLAGRDDVLLGGAPMIATQVNRIVEEDLRRAELVALPLVFLLSLFVFGGVVAALLPPLVGLVTIAGALLGLRIASSYTEISVYSLNLIVGTGLGLSIDWSLLVVSRYREELARGRRGADALAATLATAGRTVVVSACTVAGALASLLAFPQAFLRSMGIGGMLAALVGALVSLLLLPAVLALLGTRVDALSPPFLRRWTRATALPAERGFWFRLAHWVMARPGLVAVCAAGTLLALGAPFLGVRFSVVDATALPASASAFQVDQAVKRDYPRALAGQVFVAVEAPAGAGPRVARFLAAARALPQRPGVGEGRYLGGGVWRADVGIDSTGGARAEALLRELRALPAPFPVLVGGRTAYLVDQKALLLDHLPYALIVVALTTFAALFLMTGSVLLPVKAVILNLLTLAAVFGILRLVFQDGRLEGVLGYRSPGGIDVTEPMLIAALAFGLSTDYGVFLLARIKEAHDAGADDRAAIALGLERTGRIVTAAAALFVVAMAAFAASRIITVKEIGLGAALAVLLDATIVRGLLVPSLMCLLGEWNWWAPRPLARLHRRIGWSEGG